MKPKPDPIPWSVWIVAASCVLLTLTIIWRALLTFLHLA